MRAINEVMLRLSKRAEQYDQEHLVASFVDAGAMLTLLSNRDNQVIFGRRGTGKTHVLAYLAQSLGKRGDIVVAIDMRAIGSSGGIYGDSSRPLSERATRLLIDTLQELHSRLLAAVLADESIDLAAVQRPLDNFADSTVDVRVEGTIVVEEDQREINKDAMSLNAIAATGNLGVGLTTSAQSTAERGSKRTSSGNERLRVIFGQVRRNLDDFIKELKGKRVWILLDEWSEVPIDLQPYLADLLRRTIFPVQGVSVKIAAIEQRTSLRIHVDDSEGYIGIEMGADIAASLNLDEYMVFDNDAEKAGQFFKQLLYKHASALKPESYQDWPQSADRFIAELFTQSTAFDEFVIASEGVPRDAINIIGLAAQTSSDENVSVVAVRKTARLWYHRSKEGAIQGRTGALSLLRWIIDTVIRGRQAKAFLLQTGTQDNLIDYLYDSRILHLTKQGISAQDSPGIRFNVYAIDYGCYVDLLATKYAPKGMFEVEVEDNAEYINVPKTDYRSIRRSILNLGDYYDSMN